MKAKGWVMGENREEWGILGLLWVTMSGLNNLIVLPALKGKQVWGWLVRTSSYIHKL